MKKNYFLSLALTLFVTISGMCQTWTPQTSGTTNSLQGVFALSATTCYAAGVSGTILKTINGGTTWAPQTSGTTETLYSIFFTDAMNGYTVGNNATALRTINGGATWTTMTIPVGPTVSLRYVYFRDALNGFITGGTTGSVAGKVMITSDGGTTWANSTTSASTSLIYSIFFTAPTDGYTTEFSGKILKTTNGGLSWFALVSGTTSNMQNVNFSSVNNGIAVGDNGTIRLTSNMGSTWTTAVSGTSTDYLTGLDFYSPTDAVIVGGNISANTGIILTSADGGTTWTSYSPPGCSRLYRVDMVNANTGYAVGLDGTILKYTSTVGVNELENLSSFNSYPNPFSTSTVIDCANHIFNKAASVEIYDVTGKLIKNIETTPLGSLITIQRDDLSSGVYFFKVYDGAECAGQGKIIAD